MQNKFFAILAFMLVFISYSPTLAYEDMTFELRVVGGDCLINICKKYLEKPEKWREIAILNLIKDPNKIYPGQVLIIPVNYLHGIPLAGEVTFQRGDTKVQKKDNEEWLPLHIGDKVFQGNKLRTDHESAIEVTFSDGTSFFLKPNTLLGVTTTQKKGSSHIIRDLMISLGRVIAKVKQVTGTDSRFEIHTPSAVATSRGTEFRVSVDENASMRSEVLKGVIEVEALNQKVEVKEKEGTLVERGKPPIKPKKLLPPSAPLSVNPIYKMIPLRFTFGGIEGSSFIRVTLARDKDAKDILRESIIKPNETLDLYRIEDGMYYLLTQSIDEFGLEGPQSDPFLIKVRVNPMPPIIQSPDDHSEFREKSIEFKWLKVKDAVKYHIQVAEDREFAVLREDRGNWKEETYKTGILDFKTYYFRVNSIAEDGYEGEWSAAISVVLIPPPPSPPLEKPEDDEKTIRLRWRHLGGGMTYHLQMARDEAFREILIDRKLDQSSVVLERPETPGIYYVRTSSIDSKGYEGEFSPPQSFEIKPRLPLPPRLEKPNVGRKTIRFRWSHPGEGMTYHLQMARDEAFREILIDRKLDQSSVVLERPETPGIYYVRTSSIDSKGYEGEFSPPQSFEIKWMLPYEAIGIMGTIGLIILLLAH